MGNAVRKKSHNNTRLFFMHQATPHLLLGLLGTTQQTSSPSGNETGLLTLGSISRDGRSLADMLMVTTTVRMVDGVHSNTTGLGP